jgi:hypothetical protein
MSISTSGDGRDDGDFVAGLEEFVAVEIGLVAGEAGGLLVWREGGEGLQEEGPEFGLGERLGRFQEILVAAGGHAALGEETDFHGGKFT